MLSSGLLLLCCAFAMLPEAVCCRWQTPHISPKRYPLQQPQSPHSRKVFNMPLYHITVHAEV